MNDSSVANLRKEYKQHTLDITDTLPDAVAQFEQWFKEAIQAEVPEPNAMTLATLGANQQPHARIVLLKGIEQHGFVFYTNYDSHKGQELAQNPKAALTFFWAELERQVRVEGLVSKVAPEVSSAYFESRPRGSQIGAWTSPQSQEITSRTVLEEKEEALEAQYKGQTVPRPEHWGGYILKPSLIEFWQGRPSRLHDRILYTQDANGHWQRKRLAP